MHSIYFIYTKSAKNEKKIAMADNVVPDEVPWLMISHLIS